jgi:ribosomal protein S18 acetylase RimI-like enzyme
VTVAESAADIAGFACFLFDQKTEFGTYLHNIYVSPAYQRRGVASGLLVAGIVTFSTTHRQTPVHLLVFRENHSARAFYDRLGGRIVEEFDRAYTSKPGVGVVRYQWASAENMKNAALELHL